MNMKPDRPTPEELRRLYIEERLSLEVIGKKFFVSWGTVRKWTLDDGLPQIPSKSMLAKINHPMRVIVGEEHIKIGEQIDGSPITKAFIVLECGHRRTLPTYSKRGIQVPQERPVMGLTTYRCKKCYEEGSTS